MPPSLWEGPGGTGLQVLPGRAQVNPMGLSEGQEAAQAQGVDCRPQVEEAGPGARALNQVSAHIHAQHTCRERPRECPTAHTATSSQPSTETQGESGPGSEGPVSSLPRGWGPQASPGSRLNRPSAPGRAATTHALACLLGDSDSTGRGSLGHREHVLPARAPAVLATPVDRPEQRQWVREHCGVPGAGRITAGGGENLTEEKAGIGRGQVLDVH